MFPRFLQFFGIGMKKLNHPSNFEASHDASREDQGSCKNFPKHSVHIQYGRSLFLANFPKKMTWQDRFKVEIALALDMLAKWLKIGNIMKTKISFCFWVTLVAGSVSIRADDTPYQAAARAALEQKLNDLTNPQTQPAPDTSSVVAVVQSGESATNVTDTVPANVVAPQTQPAPIASSIQSSESTTNETNTVAAEALTPQTRPAPGTSSAVAVVQSGESATNVTETVSAKVTPPQTAPAATNSVAAPATVALVAEASPVVTAVAVAPAVEAPVAVTSPTVVQSTAAPVEAIPMVASATSKPTPALATRKLPTPPVKVKPANEIKTADGTIYENAQVEKVEPDGIIISYALEGGGLAMTKVYFSELSAQLRQRYEKQ
jgi:hypothetical protein